MRSTFILGVILVLIVGAVFALKSRDNSNQQQTFDDYEGSFAVEDIESVYRVQITHGDRRQFNLRRTSNGWTVNDLYKARMSSVKPLLDAIKLVTIKYIPPKAAMEHIVWDIGAHGIKVDIMDRNDDLIKTFYVGGATFDERGTHMIMEGSNQPFVTHIPTMDGSFRTRFTLGIDDWRDRHFMPIGPDDIHRLTVDYPRQQSQSFILEATRRGYTVQPLYPGIRDYPTKYRKGTGDAFVRALANAACEAYETNYNRKDSIRGLQPFMRIAITARDTAQNLDLRIYPKGKIVQSEFAPPVHRLLIDMVPGDFILVQYDVIKGMLRGYDYFFEGTEQQLIL